MAESELNSARAPWVIATRESRLALWQAAHVQRLLQALTPRPVQLLGMTTRGDQILDRSLSKVGGKGLFVKELEVALEQGRAHLAVHSLKDLPMTLPEGYALATVLEREDPRDALVSHHHDSIDDLPAGAVVGTSSLRRAAQLRAWRPDLRVEPLRGNLDTRLRKLDEGHFDAIVLAAAGLLRLGLASRVRAYVDRARMVPAAGQGALGIEVLAGADELAACLARLTDGPTWLAVHAEREVSRVLGGSCSVPLAAHAHWDGSRLLLDAAIGDAEPGPQAVLLRCTVAADVGDVASAEDLGRKAAQALIEQGARQVLDRLASSSST